jgi:hypothetical protein
MFASTQCDKCSNWPLFPPPRRTTEGYLLFEEGGSTLASWDQAIEEVCSDVS